MLLYVQILLARRYAAMDSIAGFKLHSLKPPNSDIQTVAYVIDSRNGQWIVNKMALVISPVELEAILLIPFPVIKRGDKLVWHYNSNGVFSVKSGYYLAIQLNP